jgi:type I restriction enzyme, S subunit
VTIPSLRIGEYVQPVLSCDPASMSDQHFSYIDLSAVDQAQKRIVAARRVAASEAPSRARQLVRAADILVATVRPNLNGVAKVPAELDGAIASTGFCVLRPRSDRLDANYLFHWVKSPFFVAEMVKRATGASYPAVSDQIVLDCALPVPPVPEQRRIAAVLDQADAVRAQRRAALARLDELGQSIFADLFGDVIGNSRNWPTGLALGDVADIVSGVTKGRNLAGKSTRPVPYLAVANVQDMSLALRNVKSIEATVEEIARYRLRQGDLLLTEGGDPDKLGRGCIWKDELPECIHQNHVFRVRITDQRVTPLFLNWLVGSERGKRYFLRAAKQTTGIASINMTQLRGFPLLLPPVELQNIFARRLQAIGALRTAHRVALAELDALFASLQHRAFRGEL